MIQVLFRSAKWLFISTIAILVMVVSLACFLLYTQSGMKTAIRGMEAALPTLSIGQSSGRLGSSFVLKDIRYTDPDTQSHLHIRQLSTILQGSCVFQPAVCIDHLQLDGISGQWNIPAADEAEKAKSSSPMARLSLPFPIHIRDININQADVKINDQRFVWQHFHTGLSLAFDQLAIDPTRLSHADITFGASTSSSAQIKPGPPSASSTALTLPNVQLPVDIQLPKLSVDHLVLHQAQQVTVTSLSLSGKVVNNVVTVKRLTTVVAPLGRAELSGRVALADDYHLHLSATAQLAMLNQQQVTLKATGSLKNLTVAMDLSGGTVGHVQGQFSPLQANFPFAIQASGVKGTWPLTGADSTHYQVEKLTVEGGLTHYRFHGMTTLKRGSYPTVTARLKGQGGQTSVTLSELSLQTLKGKMAGTLHADWHQGVSVSTSLALDHLQLTPLVADVSGDISGQVVSALTMDAQSNWQVRTSTLKIHGHVQGYPLTISGPFTLASGQGQQPFELHTKKLTVAHGRNQIIAQGSLSNVWKLHLQVKGRDLSESLPDTTGQVMGQVDFSGPVNDPQAALDVTTTHLGWQDQLKIPLAHLQGVVHPLQDLRGHLTLNSRAVHYQQHDMTDVHLALSGSMDRHQLTVAATVDGGKIQERLTGALSKDFHQWQGQLAAAHLFKSPVSVTLQSPAKIQVNIPRKQLQIGPHCWLQGQASLCLTHTAVIQPTQADADLAIHRFDLSALTPWLPASISVAGGVDGVAALHWQQHAAPAVNVDLRLSKGQVTKVGPQPVTVGWNTARFHGQLQQGQFAGKANIDLTDNGRLTAAIQVPNVMAKQRTLTGTLDTQGINLGFLQSYFGKDSALNGDINSHLTLAGPLMHPLMTGQLVFNHMKASSKAFPVEVKDGLFRLVFSGYQATATATIHTPDGVLTLSGDADWQDLANWRVNSRVHADGLNVKLPPMVALKAVPDMTLVMTPKGAKITGTVGLPVGKVVVESLPDSAITVSDDQVILDKKNTPSGLVTSTSYPIDTNLTVTIGDDFHLEAFGLKGDLSGKLNITQQHNAPFISGEVSILDGTYQSFGQDLVIKQGKVMFNGSVKQPYVSITAIRNPDNIDDDVTAGIKVTGQADSPSIAVFSDPTMSQANALSYLLRGQSLDAESDSDDTAMTSTLIGLSLAQSGHLVGELGQAVGVQDLKLDTAGSGEDSEVTVSGYVLPGLKVQYGVGIFNSVGEFTVRYRLMHNFYVEAVSGLTSTVDFLYQFQFD